jgi:hypothetical protein
MEIEQVSDQDPELANSPIEEELDNSGLGLAAADADAADADAADADTDAVYCKWNGEDYSHGAEVCNNHRIYACFNGKWFRGVGSC